MSLLGLANYYHHFIQDFSEVTRTLPDFSKKNAYPRSGMNFVTKLLRAQKQVVFDARAQIRGI
jgi:hypothetical protein